MTTHTAKAFGIDTFSTTDPDQGHDWMRRTFVDVDVTIRGDDDDFVFATQNVRLGNAFITHLRHSMAVTMDATNGVDWQAFYLNLQPSIEIDVDQRVHRLGANGAMTLTPGHPYTVTWDTLEAFTIGLDQTLLDDLAAAQLDPGQPLRFDFDTALSPIAADHWQRTVTMTRQIALSNTANPDGALLADHLGRLLASAALTCFPNTTLTNASDNPRTRNGSPASIRRAVAYIDAHLDQPVTLTDIADAAGITARSLHESFRRHLDTTPMAYLRRGRLARAHHDLQAARPGDGHTVTSIANRWGFHSLPRFGVTYRKTYGTPPSHTLRRS